MEIDIPDGIPEGYTIIKNAIVYTNGKTVTITGEPPEDDPEYLHNCDAMGCNWEHVLLKLVIPVWQRPVIKAIVKPHQR